jgi:hypothetical protein
MPGINFMVGLLTTGLQFLGDMFEGIKTMIMSVGRLFSGDFVGFMRQGFGGFVAAIMSIVDVVVNVIVDMINFVIDQINNVFKLLANTPLGDFARDVLGFDVNVGIPRLPKVNFSTQVLNAIGLATGGTVMPRAGGTLAMIGEAGRPERVEPLDPDGLSKRDKAMISMLSGGAGGGVNITVNASPGMDATELAAIVSRRISYELRRGATA